MFNERIPVRGVASKLRWTQDSLRVKQVEEQITTLRSSVKVGIPDAILRKPSRLDADEYALMKKHPEYGWAVLRTLPGFERAALDILHHHENFDGKGYPAGLKELEFQLYLESSR